MKSTLLKHKNEIKYKTFGNIKILGIGQKAIKYRVDDGEDKFAFYDSYEGFSISTMILKSFDNECWNDEIRAKIAAQAQYCKENNLPNFSDDGFCIYCRKQSWNHISLQRASSDHVTRCHSCSRTYLD